MLDGDLICSTGLLQVYLNSYSDLAHCESGSLLFKCVVCELLN